MSALKLFRKTNTKGAYMLAAWHPSAAINWKWQVWWQWSWRPFFHYWNGKNGHGHVDASIPLVGRFWLSWQTMYWWDK